MGLEAVFGFGKKLTKPPLSTTGFSRSRESGTDRVFNCGEQPAGQRCVGRIQGSMGNRNNVRMLEKSRVRDGGNASDGYGENQQITDVISSGIVSGDTDRRNQNGNHGENETEK